MKISARLIFPHLSSVLFAFSLFSAGVAHAEDVRIAYVNPDRIMREANFAKAIFAKGEQEFAKRKRDLDDMAARLQAAGDKYDREAPLLADAERMKRQRELADMEKDLGRKQREAQEDYNQLRNEEFAAVSERVTKTINQISVSENYDIVLQDALYHSPRVDITDKVLKALNK